jgi:polyhydroxyalkanoate synthesis regulator phasin
MSNDKKSKVSDKASEIARNIWLAGLGAYGKAFDEAQKGEEQSGRNRDRATSRLFQDLVEKGSELEGDARETLEEIRDTHTSAVEARIRKVRENFNLSKFTRDNDVTELKARIDELTATVESLTAAVAKLTPVKKAAAKKAPAKKAAPKKAPAKNTLAKKKRK